ncbi:aminoacyl-tRNA hydrolase [Gloeocapsa sp. PCC 73106]|uniref:aminoacyl-tRNA hydrolase n=1 Tax=Gloeocapsa sp. PCC 73106 TaxID=102232 RepID=UPI0002AC6DF3|nr:aminoacyl-tRNA hydrolase [Gloeocapsa sp. PCC 73106]ELR99824.1 peptidyl-tRNA hydrolase [Gloeocapsa sp. PCC 73106]
MIPQLIIGLGNPEPKYLQTRHNIGFMVLDTLAQAWGLSWQEEKRFQGLFSEGKARGGKKVYLLKPLTYMNLSGQSVRAVVDWYKLPTDSLLVVYDDLDLPVGRLRLRRSGSAGGHNGMKSIIAHLGGQDFSRLRIGIGKSNVPTISHVLGKFTPSEKKAIDEVMKVTIAVLELSLKEGLDQAMNQYNNYCFE